MKIVTLNWENDPVEQNHDKRGEHRILTHCGNALQKNNYDVYPWLFMQHVNPDIGIGWVNLEQNGWKNFDNKNLPLFLAYSNHIDTEIAKNSIQKGILPLFGQNSQEHLLMTSPRKKELSVWRNMIDSNLAEYLPFPHVEEVGTKSNFNSNNFIIPMRTYLLRREHDQVKIVNCLIDILSTSPGGVQETGKIFLPCDSIPSSFILSEHGRKLLAENRLVAMEKTSYSDLLNLLSDSKMSLGTHPQGGSQYEAISMGCLPGIWVDSIFWPSLIDVGSKNNLKGYSCAINTWSYSSLYSFINNILCNECLYNELLNSYRKVLNEYTYKNFTAIFEKISNKWRK